MRPAIVPPRRAVTPPPSAAAPPARPQELRIRRSEQQWEFVIPSTFSTRLGSAGGALANIAATLNRFFKARSEVSRAPRCPTACALLPWAALRCALPRHSL
jgi:hypothetical protein